MLIEYDGDCRCVLFLLQFCISPLLTDKVSPRIPTRGGLDSCHAQPSGLLSKVAVMATGVYPPSRACFTARPAHTHTCIVYTQIASHQHPFLLAVCSLTRTGTARRFSSPNAPPAVPIHRPPPVLLVCISWCASVCTEFHG